jgi:hypothetical protein
LARYGFSRIAATAKSNAKALHVYSMNANEKRRAIRALRFEKYNS